MAHIAQLHGRLQVTIMVFMLVIGMWGMVNAARRQPITQTYSAMLIIGELLFVAQALLGGILLLAGALPVQLMMHVIYGVVGVFMLPTAFALARARAAPWDSLIYSLACLLLAGIAIRAWETATVLPFLYLLGMTL